MLSLVFAALQYSLEIKLRYTIKEIQLRNTMLNLIGIRDTFKMSPQKMEGRMFALRTGCRGSVVERLLRVILGQA